MEPDLKFHLIVFTLLVLLIYLFLFVLHMIYSCMRRRKLRQKILPSLGGVRSLVTRPGDFVGAQDRIKVECPFCHHR